MISVSINYLFLYCSFRTDMNVLIAAQCELGFMWKPASDTCMERDYSNKLDHRNQPLRLDILHGGESWKKSPVFPFICVRLVVSAPNTRYEICGNTWRAIVPILKIDDASKIPPFVFPGRAPAPQSRSRKHPTRPVTERKGKECGISGP